MAKEFRERKIPCEVMGLEPGWQTHAYSCSFAWDETKYPDPKGFVAGAEGEGVSGESVGACVYASDVAAV